MAPERVIGDRSRAPELLMALLAAVVVVHANQDATPAPLAARICAKPPGYTGAMVLPAGSRDGALCQPEFAGDGLRTYLPYDYVAMDPSVLTASPTQHTVQACQAACHAADDAKRGCQYFVFKGYAPPAKRCALRLAGVAPASFAPNDTAPKVLFELSPNRYSAYYGLASDWAALGIDLAAFATLDAARTSCAALAPCIGIKYSQSGGARPYKTFAGSLMEDVVGKVRTTGPSINPWMRYN